MCLSSVSGVSHVFFVCLKFLSCVSQFFSLLGVSPRCLSAVLAASHVLFQAVVTVRSPHLGPETHACWYYVALLFHSQGLPQEPDDQQGKPHGLRGRSGSCGGWQMINAWKDRHQSAGRRNRLLNNDMIEPWSGWFARKITPVVERVHQK